MQKSTYYDLNLVEGVDVYNPLINDVPNYETIDQAMHDNAVAGITVATELASGNVHAITRSNPECAVIRFVATSDWKTNDRMTIDGTEVTVRMVDGSVLKNNAYLINSNVLGILTGTLFTVYVVPFVPENASDIRFNDDETVYNAIIKDREDITLLNRKLNNNNILTPRLFNCSIVGGFFSNGYKVTVNMKLTPTSVVQNDWNTFATDMPKPKIDDSIPLFCIDSAGTVKICNLNINGELFIYSPKVNDVYYISGEYISK